MLSRTSIQNESWKQEPEVEYKPEELSQGCCAGNAFRFLLGKLAGILCGKEVEPRHIGKDLLLATILDREAV